MIREAILRNQTSLNDYSSLNEQISNTNKYEISDYKKWFYTPDNASENSNFDEKKSNALLLNQSNKNYE